MTDDGTHDEETGEEPEDSLLGFLGGEDDDAEHDEEAGYGLELDDSQAGEIRTIFLVTLPQYLEPIEQMLDQLFAEGDEDGSIAQALSTAILSIIEAASKIGIDDVAAELERMHVRLAAFSAGDASTDEARSDLHQSLTRIRAIGGDESEKGTGERSAPSPTLFQALKYVSGIDAFIIQRLTTAGLHSVEQFQMASTDELVAVTGLDLEVIEYISRALAAGFARPTRTSGIRYLEPSDPLEAELLRKLQAQVEASDALDEERMGVARLRARTEILKREVAETETSTEQIRQRLKAAQDELAASLTEQSEVREQVAKFERRNAAGRAAFEDTRRHLARLRRRRKSGDDRRSELTDEVQELIGRVSRKLAGRGRS